MCGRIPIVVEMLAFGKETNQPDAYFVIRRAIPSRLMTTCRRADELVGMAPFVMHRRLRQGRALSSAHDELDA